MNTDATNRIVEFQENQLNFKSTAYGNLIFLDWQRLRMALVVFAEKSKGWYVRLLVKKCHSKLPLLRKKVFMALT